MAAVCLCSLLLPLLLSFVCQTKAATFKVLGLYDSTEPHMVKSLSYAVDRINYDVKVLPGHSLVLTTAATDSMDVYTAVEKVCSSLLTGLDVIIDGSSPTVRASVRNLAESVGVPYLGWGQHAQDGSKYSGSFNFDPPEVVMVEAIADIVNSENMTNIAFVFDCTFNYNILQRRILKNVPAQHIYLAMPRTTPGMDTQLSYMKSNHTGYIFLLASAEDAGAYLNRAFELGLMTFKFHWFVLTKDSSVTCTKCSTKNNYVTMAAEPDPVGSTPYVTFMATKSSEFTTKGIEVDRAFVSDVIYLGAESLTSYLTNHTWIQPKMGNCGRPSNTTLVAQAAAVVRQMTDISTPGTFGPFDFSNSSANPTETMVLNLKNVAYTSGKFTANDLGTWSSGTGLSGSSLTVSTGKRTFRISTIVEPPFVFKDISPEGAVTYDGYCFQLIKHLSRLMNFEYTIVEAPDGKYGSLQADGKWNGMVNELILDRADIIVAPMSVMAERESVIDYTVPFYDLVGITILMRKPVFQYQLFKFMKVLEDNVWICFLSAFFLCSILLWLFDRFGPYSYQNNRARYWDGVGAEPRVFDLKEGIWFCFTSMTPQGGGEAPMGISAKLIAAAWWVFAFIMIATYTANLAAFLTVSRLETPIESLDDLAKQFKTKYAPQQDTSTHTYFRRMADIEDRFYGLWKDMSMNSSLDVAERARLAVWDYPVSDKFTAMWTSMEDAGFPATFQEAIARVKSPKPDEEAFAFIGDATKNKYAAMTNCEFWEVGQEFSRKPYALAVQEGQVALRNELSDSILHLLNQRILEDMKAYWWEYNMKECPKVEDESEGISLKNIGGVFLLIFMGVGFAILALIWEYFWYKYRVDRKKEREKALERESRPPDIQVSHVSDVDKNKYSTEYAQRSGAELSTLNLNGPDTNQTAIHT